MRKINQVIALATFLFADAAAAVDLYSTRDMPIYHMTGEDRQILMAVAVDTLERNRDGEAARWENPKTGAHGNLTPQASFERDGRPCRDLEVANSARGYSNRLVITMCKQTGGEWKIEPQ